MKTMGFSDLVLQVSPGGIVSLFVKKPGEEQMEIKMSHDELMVFLVECTNKLYESSQELLKVTAKRNLEREQRRSL